MANKVTLPGFRGPLLAAVTATVFFAWYALTAATLPAGAGPDHVAHMEAAQFLFEYGRLAVIPEDEDKLNYTVYGSTRTLRPPLTYLVAAAIARLNPPEAKEIVVPPQGDFATAYRAALQPAFRLASALLSALAVAATALALWWIFGSLRVALAGASLIGLMPQFAFIASYTNDDAGALFAAGMAFLAIALLYRRGLNGAIAALTGIAAGLLILSKPTAWLLLPTLALAVGLFARASARRMGGYALIALFTMVLGGGWWLLFNISHYGLGDPTARQTAAALGERHRQLAPSAIRSFADKGAGFRELILDNFDGFWPRTIKSTIGKLDWLRLNVGPLQYGFYISIFVIALGYFLLRVLYTLVLIPRHGWAAPDWRRLGLEGVLFFAVIFQFTMFTWRNIHTEIQLQGRYLLPALPAIIILFLAAVQKGAAIASRWLETGHRPRTLLTSRGLLPLTAVLLALVAAGIHVHALKRYVIPFYWPFPYSLSVWNFTPLAVDRSRIRIINDVADLRTDGTRIQLEATGTDPSFIIVSAGCHAPGNLLIKIGIQAQQADIFQLFVDRGQGFSERDAVSRRYRAGKNELLFAIDGRGCGHLRLDPATRAGPVDITDIAMAKLNVRQPKR